MTKDELNGIRNRANYWQDRKNRAQSRLKSWPLTGSWLYFAVLGLDDATPEYNFGELDFARLLKVVEPPGEVELAGALKNNGIFGALGRYSHHIKFEIAVCQKQLKDLNHGLTLGHYLISALRVKSKANLLIPAVASCSWSTIAALSDNSCQALLLEDVPQARLTLTTITAADLDWTADNLTKFAEVAQDAEHFALANDAFCTHAHCPNLRVETAQLWAGVEAIFKVEQELRFRLAAYVAALLEPRGEERKKLYDKVKKMYDLRSKAVHGVKIKDEILKEHIAEVRVLLSRIMTTIVESGKMPSDRDFDLKLFC
jgi:hypothetical protein